MPTVEATGSIVTTASEADITSSLNPLVLVLWLDMTNMQAGDTIVVKVYRKVVSAGGYVLFDSQTIEGAQDGSKPWLCPVKCTLPVTSPHACKFTIQRTAGADRTFSYSLESA